MVREGYHPITVNDWTYEALKKIKKDNGHQTIPETIRAIVRYWNLGNDKVKP